ncbi:unnamed protein product [Mytilus edulis]|uniref:COR domain-containing protein n=1 Tax=Mytilus edulis TaxID=6550 RepID=A0A8S3RCB9_MYTED|nr:unnamed protein product [Mytilus edulis]
MTAGYNLKCPARAEWKLRGNISCSAEDKYVCLFHLLDQKYMENCLGSDRSSIGSKLVFQPLFNLAECNSGRYQPIVFTTHGNSECIYSQSKCTAEGQVVFSNGSARTDTTCRCDYTKGYAFVTRPKNSCFCNPSDEDCSCFRVTCTKLSAETDDDLTRLIHQVYKDKLLNATAETVIDQEPPSSKRDESRRVSGKSLSTSSSYSDYKDTFKDDTSSVRNESDDTLWIGSKIPDIHSVIPDNKNNHEQVEIDLNQIQKDNVKSENANGHTVKNYLNENVSDPVNDENINEMTSTIMKSCLKSTTEEQNDMLAFCWLWDFAGQKEFYATHQVFLSKCAVYLLVTDSLEFSTAENQGLDFEGSAEYVCFWFDAIHCYWSTTKKGRLDPPIIVVCTNEDRFKDADIVFEEIRKEIYRQAMEMEDWGKICPLKWLLFQQVLLKLRDNNVPISSTKTLLKIAKHDDIGISEENEVKRCLQYCNDNGTVIYFDEENLADHVILNPKWLIKAFRCLVSDKIDNVIEVSDDWQQLKDTGQLTDSLISRLFRKEPNLKFEDNKAHLIEVMKRFDIIVNLKDSTTLYMPCMIKSCSFSEVQKQFSDGSQSIHKTSWLCLEFKFLPPAFFNHIIAWYIKQYHVSVIIDQECRSERNALYRQVGVFDLDSSSCKQLVVCEGPNTIALQVWDSRMSNETYEDLGLELFGIVETLLKRYSLHISYRKTFTCKDGDFTIQRKTIEDLVTQEYRCSEHKTNHISDDLVKPWTLRQKLQ